MSVTSIAVKADNAKGEKARSAKKIFKINKIAKIKIKSTVKTRCSRLFATYRAINIIKEQQ
jgi:hypothetical protein